MSSATSKRTVQVTGCARGIDPWEAPPQAVVLGYGGVLAAHDYTPITQHAIAALTALAEYGVRLVLACDTDDGQRHAADQLRLAGVSWCFDAVLDTAHPSVCAPDPRYFTAALDRINQLVPDTPAPGVVWVAGSAEYGIIPAIQHGMRAVWISRSDNPRLTAVPQVRRIETITQLPFTLGLPVHTPRPPADPHHARSPAARPLALPQPRRPVSPDRPGNEYS